MLGLLGVDGGGKRRDFHFQWFRVANPTVVILNRRLQLAVVELCFFGIDRLEIKLTLAREFFPDNCSDSLVEFARFLQILLDLVW